MESKAIRIERFKTWSDLRKAALRYEALGISSEVRGWDDMRANKLTVYGDYEEAADGNDE